MITSKAVTIVDLIPDHAEDGPTIPAGTVVTVVDYLDDDPSIYVVEWAGYYSMATLGELHMRN